MHSNVSLKLDDFSLFGLSSIKSLDISFSCLIGANNKNKLHIVSNLKSLKLYKMIDKRSYYESVNLMAMNNFNDDQLNEMECFLILFFIKFDIHFNLKSENDLLKFEQNCRFLEIQ